MEANLNISTLSDLLESLPEEQKTNDLIGELRTAYALEVTRLIEYAKQAEKPNIFLQPFTKQGDQFIAVFSVNDLAKPKEEKYNWHGQNMSQWVYAGCICVQDGEVSLHH